MVSKRQREPLRVFLSSSNDVHAAREKAEQSIENLNRLIGSRLSVYLDIIRWERNIAPDMGRPQEVINEQARIGDCDIFIGIIGTRFGTPTGARHEETNEPFLSGTEEEFCIAYEHWKRVKTPRILFYRNTTAPRNLLELDAVQYARVQGFFDKFRQDGVHPGLVKTFTSLDEFEESFSQKVLTVAEELVAKRIPSREALDLDNPFRALGIKRLFLPAHNHFREEEKRDYIMKAESIKLVANSGHSFLALIGHRYRTQIYERLSSGVKFEIVLTNPWSETGLAIASQEFDKGEEWRRSLFDGGATRDEVEEVIASSRWYAIKLKDALEGYQALKAEFPEKVTLFFTSYPITATTLFTDNGGFFEPYTHIGAKNRYRAGMLTFEINFSKESHLFNLVQLYFDSLKNCAFGAEDFLGKE